MRWVEWMKSVDDYFETRGSLASLQVRPVHLPKWVTVTVDPQLFAESIEGLRTAATDIWPEVDADLALFRLLWTDLWEYFESSDPEDVSAAVEFYARGFRPGRTDIK